MSITANGKINKFVTFFMFINLPWSIVIIYIEFTYHSTNLFIFPFVIIDISFCPFIMLWSLQQFICLINEFINIICLFWNNLIFYHCLIQFWHTFNLFSLKTLFCFVDCVSYTFIFGTIYANEYYLNLLLQLICQIHSLEILF